ncbi:MAG: hypothetical protein FWE42_03290 [Defluviitaleaceae bacterium]|nr:hypothetical protein [Defluviitaleaceae bacterium]
MGVQLGYYNSRRINHLFPTGKGEKIYIGSEMGRSDFIHLNYSELLNGDYIPCTLWLWLERNAMVNISDLANRFPSIESLYLFRDLIPFEKANLENLKTFSLGRFANKDSPKNLEHYQWNPEQILPNAKALFYMEKSHFDLGGFLPSNLPNLEWLECHYLDDERLLLEKICQFDAVTSLSLSKVGNNDILGAFNNRLKLLRLEGFGKKFSFDKIANQTSLEILYINGYKKEFDLMQLQNLKLKEIQLLNCSKIVNAEALLEMDCLESLFVLSCKNALSAELKLKLKERNFAYLNIDFT